MSLGLAPHPALFPLAAVYGAAVSFRKSLYDRGLFSIYKSRLPVICIGNATAGGSGKSPFAQYVVQLLHDAGQHPVLLSRGYGGSNTGPWLVGAGDSAATIGDEALMHRLALPETIPVVISRKRSEGVKLIETEDLGNVIVLDDGLQHLALARDLNVLLLDASDEASIARWRDGKLLPAGWLREPFADVLGRSHCVVFVRRGAAASSALPALPETASDSEVPQFSFELAPSDYLRYGAKNSFPLTHLSGKPVCAFTSIAGPENFFRCLETLGAELKSRRAFCDHHLFSKAEIDALAASELPLVCTEKDAVKLRGLLDPAYPCYVLRLNGRFRTPGAREGFAAFLSGKLQQH